MLVTNPRCESQTGNVVTDVAAPRLSWSSSSTFRGDAQTAYQIQCGTTLGASDLWDTGKVSSTSQRVPYAGTALAARRTVYWQVRIWDSANNPSQYRTAIFEVGLLAASDWGGAVQIAHATVTTAAVGNNPSANVRKDFTAQDKVVTRAQLYVSAVGLYRPFLNGVRVGNEELSPGWTNYAKRMNYQRFNVTQLVRRNAVNAVGLSLGDGLGVGQLNRGRGAGGVQRNTYGTGGIPYAVAVLYVEYADGTSDRIVTDATWKATTGANLANDIYQGGITDNRLDLNFTDPTVSSSGWPVVSATRAFPTALMKAQPCAPIRRREILTPIASPTLSGSTYIFDMGVNHSGIPLVTVVGATAGQEITVQYAEKLNANGSMYLNNLQNQTVQIYKFVCQGLPSETFEPLHAQSGGRYISMLGYPGTPPITAMRSIRIAADLRRTATFTSSSALFNTMFLMAERSIDANTMAVLTDCHQRPERLGWLFDVVASVGFFNFIRDSTAYLEKYALDMDDGQVNGKWPDTVPTAPSYGFNYGAAGWHFGGYMIPWTVYQFTGDASILSNRNASLKAGLAIEPCTNPWGDYLPSGPETDDSVTSYAFACRAAQLMVKIATVIGDSSGLANAQSRLASFLTTFQTYIAADGTITGDTQAAYVWALCWDLCGDKKALCLAKLVASLQANGIQTGLPGTAFLLEALTLNRRADVAFALVTDTTKLGWAQNAVQTVTGNPALTVFPERWNGITFTGTTNQGSNSLCHHVRAGPIGEWLIRRVAGIDFEGSVGFSTVALRPFLGSLTGASATVETLKGRVSSTWSVTPKGFSWTFDVPPGCVATITMPVARTPTENGIPVTFTQLSADPITGGARYQVGSGRYTLFA
jgi:alpha-L-rhamnosidase